MKIDWRIAHAATTEGLKGEDIRDLMVSAVEHRFGRINRPPTTIRWLTDNDSCDLAGETRRYARHIGLGSLIAWAHVFGAIAHCKRWLISERRRSVGGGQVLAMAGNV